MRKTVTTLLLLAVPLGMTGCATPASDSALCGPDGLVDQMDRLADAALSHETEVPDPVGEEIAGLAALIYAGCGG